MPNIRKNGEMSPAVQAVSRILNVLIVAVSILALMYFIGRRLFHN